MGAVVAVVDRADQPGLRVDPGDDGAPAGDAIAAASEHLAQRELDGQRRHLPDLHGYPIVWIKVAGRVTLRISAPAIRALPLRAAGGLARLVHQPRRRALDAPADVRNQGDRKSTRLNSSH